MPMNPLFIILQDDERFDLPVDLYWLIQLFQ